MNADHAERALQGRGTKLIIALVILGLGLAALAVGAAMYFGVIGPERSLWALMPAGFGAIFALAGLWSFFANLGAWMAERRIGTPAIAVQHRPASSGLDISVRLASGARVSGVSAMVEVHETVIINRGEDITTKTHRIGEQAWELLPRGEPNLFGAELPMAALASFPPALGLPGARIEWGLVLTVRLPGWPDWNDSVPLDAYPGGVRPSLPAPYLLTFD